MRSGRSVASLSPGHSQIGCEIKSGSGLGTRLGEVCLGEVGRGGGKEERECNINICFCYHNKLLVYIPYMEANQDTSKICHSFYTYTASHIIGNPLAIPINYHGNKQQ